jgi:Icc-related predicted phosphoesterase
MAVPVLVFVRRWIVCGFVAAVVVSPILAEQAVERARFEDRLGTFPVEVGLAHNGRSTLDAGIVGKLYWDRTGVGGFGASLRSSGPPEGGGTLGSYVSQDFLQANVAFVDDPGELARVYGAELRSQVVRFLVVSELAVFVAGGLLGAVLLRGPPRYARGRVRVLLRGGWFTVASTTTLLLAAALFARWDGSAEPAQTYAMPGIDELSFSSPQTREIAQQIQPFVEKNAARIAERSAAYVEAAVDGFNTGLPLYAEGVRPREGEKVVLAEADPQGSQVATRLRARLYPLLVDALGDGAVVLRTVAGDVTSNGTVAEQAFVAREAAASDEVPLVMVKGDHDSDDTVEQMRDEDVEVPDLEIVDVGGLRVAGAADPAFKALFGGMVTNPSGVTETELGTALRKVVDEDLAEGEDGPKPIVVVHQPRAAAAYLGLVGTSELDELVGNETTPVDDGIPDVPEGMVTYGHLHDPAGPWVIWNTDGDEVTWTVVTQLGTSGGVEENPTFNRFSTPFSVPLKDTSLQLAYVNPDTGLQTGYVLISISPTGTVTFGDRVEVGLPDGEPGDLPD